MSEPQPHNEPEIPKPSFFERSGLKTALFFTVLGLIGLTLAVMDLKPDLGHVEAAVLSGPAQGNYHAVVMDTPSRAPAPRVDVEVLKERSKGLIALSSSLAGEIPQALLRGQLDDARKLARQYQGIFEDGFYLEIVRNGIKEQEAVNERMLELSAEMGIPVVAAADAHYSNKEDAAAHEILMYVKDVSADLDIWQHKRYLDPPRLAQGDGPIGLYRRWARQFYVPAVSRVVA